MEREFRLERARDAEAAEETNGGFRPALSSTRRSVALRERAVAADGRPWHERLGDDDAYASARKAKDASRALVAEAMESAAMDAPRTATRTEEERDRTARAMHAEAATRDARRDADRRDEAREMARRAPKLAARDVERLVRKARVAAVRAIERRAVRDGSYLERDALGPALRDAGVFASAPPTTRGAIRDEARAVYRLCACLGEGEGDHLAVPAWLFARFVGAVSRAETDRVRDRERDDETRDTETDANVDATSFHRSRGGSDLGREFDVGRRARGSRTPWWPAGYSAEREASLAETFASVAGTAAANAKLSRTPIGRDRNRRSDPDDEPDRDDASACTVSAPTSPAARLSFAEPSSAPGSVYRPPPSPATSASASASSRRSAARLGYPGESVADRLARKRAETERAIAERRAAKEAEESAECTFRPKITRGYRPSSANANAIATSSTSTRAYVSASEKYPTREQREAMELAECTFKPKINKPPRYLVDKPPGEPLKAWERRAPSAEEASRREEARRRAREASNNPTERWSGPPPWEPRKGKIRRPPPPPPPPRTARPRSAAPPGYDETVRRMRAAKEARETRGEASVLDSRAAWVDPRGAADEKKKKAEAKAAKTRARLAKAATQNLPAAWRASSSARKIRTSRDGTGGIPPSPTTEKETTEPDGDRADDEDVFARATESNAQTSATATAKATATATAPSRSPSIASPPNRSASPSRASPRRPPPLEVELSFGSSADFGARSAARSPRDAYDSPKGLPSTPPSANRRASSTSTPTRMASSPGSPVLSASATLDLRKNAPSLTPLPRSPRSGDATPASPVSPDGLPYTKFEPGPVILAVELAIGETRDAKTRTLEFREGDRVPDAARRFCDAHRLPNSVAADVEVVLEESLRVYFAEAAR